MKKSKKTIIDFSGKRRAFSPEDQKLDKKAFDPCPFTQSAIWLQEVEDKEILDGNAMTLSTGSPSGEITARTVLLKYLDERGFVFFTNYQSRKSKDIASNPKAALTFYWPILNKQICVMGEVKKVPFEETDDYFQSRPRLNQLLAISSIQDKEIQSIDEVLTRIEQLDNKYQNQKIPTPDFWGGFLLRPYKFEFWQGGQGRVNMRFAYFSNGSKWELKQLSP